MGNTISDAVVMAASDVSLAFYKDNLDRVTEVADVVLLQEDLSLIHKSIELSKKTYRIIAFDDFTTNFYFVFNSSTFNQTV